MKHKFSAWQVFWLETFIAFVHHALKMAGTKAGDFPQLCDASSVKRSEAARSSDAGSAYRRIPRLPRRAFREKIPPQGDRAQELPDALAVSQERRQPKTAPDAADLFATGGAAPRTETEKLVARMWADVLQQRKIGVNEDFFARGGHSLSAMRVLARLYSTFGVELPVRTIFDSPTVATLAARIDASRFGRQPGGTPLTT